MSLDRVSTLDPNAEKIKSWKKNYLAPGNAKKLAPPALNGEIWDLLNSTQRAQDTQFKHCQSLISISLVAQARILAYVRELHKEKKDLPHGDILKMLAEPLMDSASALGLAMKDLNIKRRSALRKAIPALAGINWNRSMPTELLYGDKIQEELKSTKAASALLRKPTEGYRKRRPNSGFFRGGYSGNYSRQAKDKRAKPSSPLNYREDSKGARSSGSRRQAPRDYPKQR